MFRGIRKIEKALEITEGVIDDIPQVTCYGRTKVVVSNYTGILEYEEYVVRLNSGEGTIYVYGDNLQITELTVDDIMVCGKIHSVEFER